MSRYFIHLAYDGTAYHGWQIQPNAISVQECMQNGLSAILASEVSVMGCGRTDTKVHATQFYAHFDFEEVIDLEQLKLKLNGYLNHDIAIYEIFQVKDRAHTRFHATQRSYQYYIHQNKDAFLHNRSYYFRRKLNFHTMNTAARVLLDYSDFGCFSKTNTQVNNNICKITNASWELIEEGKWQFNISANRFLRGMVRAIVGTLIDLGEGKIDQKKWIEILEGKDRTLAGASAPAHGLYLSKVVYPNIPE